MNLTENEIIILKASRTNNFCDCVEEGDTWVFAVIDESDLDAKVARGTISSLVKKGLVVVSDYEGKGRAYDMCFCLTDEGKEITIELTETSVKEEKQMLTSNFQNLPATLIRVYEGVELEWRLVDAENAEYQAFQNGEEYRPSYMFQDWKLKAVLGSYNWLMTLETPIQSISPEFKEFALQNHFTADLASNRIELESPESYGNGEYFPDGVLLLDHDSLDIWSFPDEQSALEWLQGEFVCVEGQQLMQKLPVEVAVRSVGQMPDKVWESNRDWWTHFYLIVASCYSEEIGESIWTEVNELLGRLKG